MFKRIMQRVFGRGTFLPFFKEGNDSRIHSNNDVLGTMNRLLYCSKVHEFTESHSELGEEQVWADVYVRELGRTNAELGHVLALEGDANSELSIKEWYQVEHSMFREWFKTYSKSGRLDTTLVSRWIKAAPLSMTGGYSRYTRDHAKHKSKWTRYWCTMIRPNDSWGEQLGFILTWTILLSTVGTGLLMFLPSIELSMLMYLKQWISTIGYWSLGVAAFHRWYVSIGGPIDVSVFLSDLSSSWEQVFELNSEADVWLVSKIIVIMQAGDTYEKHAVATFGHLTPRQAALALMEFNNGRRASVIRKISKLVTFAPEDSRRTTGIPVSEFQQYGKKPNESFKLEVLNVPLHYDD